MKRTGSAGRLVVRGLLGLLLAFVALNGALLLRPTPIARLVLPPDPPADQNGWPILAQACGQLNRSVEVPAAAWQGYPGRANGAEPSMQQYLAANAPALQTLYRALDRPTMVQPAAELRRPFDDRAKRFASSRELARVLVQQAYCDEAAGRCEAAAGQAWDVALLGRRWEGSHTALMGWLVGVAIEAIGNNALVELTGRPPGGADPQRDDPTVAWPLPRLDRAQYGKFRDLLEHFGDGRDHVAAFEGALASNLACDRYYLREDAGSPLRRYPVLRALPMVFDPAQTEQLTESLYTRVLEEVKQPRWRRPAVLVERSPESFSPDPKVTWAWCYNPVGHSLSPDMGPTIEAAAEKCTALKARRHLTGIVLALRLYADDHGHLPATPAELTRAGLSVALQDPYDGNPLRYHPREGLVYCVGENLRDDGGIHTKEGCDDVAVRIPFVRGAEH